MPARILQMAVISDLACQLCRTYAIIWRAVLTGVFTLIPTFKHMRIICILGLVGTSYTAVCDAGPSPFASLELLTPRKGEGCMAVWSHGRA